MKQSENVFEGIGFSVTLSEDQCTVTIKATGFDKMPAGARMHTQIDNGGFTGGLPPKKENTLWFGPSVPRTQDKVLLTVRLSIGSSTYSQEWTETLKRDLSKLPPPPPVRKKRDEEKED